MKKKILIIIPKINNDGPIKGAFALANSLFKKKFNVSVVVVNNSNLYSDHLNKKINLIFLKNNIIQKIFLYRSYLNELHKKKYKVYTISFCFEADVINSFSLNDVFTICSMRANIFDNYKFQYNLFGYILAKLHYFFIRNMNTIVSMHKPMSNQIRKYYSGNVKIIHNFVDEEYLNKFSKIKDKRINKNLIYVGLLNRRKNPGLLIDAVRKLIIQKNILKLDIVGDGELKEELEQKVIEMKLKKYITFHGHLENPYKLMKKADILLLPSYSEGTSRALLEALHLGLTCIIRNIDGVRELRGLSNSILLFNKNEEFIDKIKLALKKNKKNCLQRKSLIPLEFRQNYCVNRYIELIK